MWLQKRKKKTTKIKKEKPKARTLHPSASWLLYSGRHLSSPTEATGTRPPGPAASVTSKAGELQDEARGCENDTGLGGKGLSLGGGAEQGWSHAQPCGPTTRLSANVVRDGMDGLGVGDRGHGPGRGGGRSGR